jgi:hypothetical protein
VNLMKATKDIHALLTEADPLRTESGLSDADAERMRRVVLSAPQEIESGYALWPRAIAIAAVVVLMIVGGTIVGVRMPPSEPAGAGESVAIPEEAAERRQLQFATPGGTRIIWTLDPDFKLGEGVP